MSFTNKVVLITGAGSGMGRAMAHEFAGGGASIVALDINAETAAETATSVGGDAMAVQADVGAVDDVSRALREVLQAFGKVDVLCNNAGILDGYADALSTSDELWQRVIATNLTGPFLMSRAVLPPMLEQGAGVIINTGSTSAFVAGGGGAAYTASKHGIVGLTKQLAYNFGKQGVRVNAICPGATRTGMTADLMEDEHVGAMIDATIAQRWAEPEEVARLAVYLASDAASFAHGATFVLDGGWLVT